MSVLKFISYQLGKDVTLTREEALEGIEFEANRFCGAYRNNRGDYCKQHYQIAYKIPAEFASDREFMLKAVGINGAMLQSASEELQRDKELILIAADHCIKYNLHIPEEYFSDREFMLKLVSLHGMFLKEYKTFDREMFFIAVKNDSEAVGVIKQYGESYGDYLKNRDFVTELIQANPLAIKYVDDCFRDDDELVFLAAAKLYLAFECASRRLRNDDTFIRKLLKVNPMCLAYAPRSYKEDKDLVFELMEIHPYCYRYVKGELLNDVDLAILAINKNLKLYQYVAGNIISNKKFLAELKRLAENDVENQRYWKLQFDLIEKKW